MAEEQEISYGLILRKVRVKQGFKLGYVAKKLDTTPEIVSLIERGHRRLSVETFITLLDLYELSLSEFKEELGEEAG